MLVVNPSGNHKGLRLLSWFFRYSFADISLDLRDWRGFSCGKSGRNHFEDTDRNVVLRERRIAALDSRATPVL
jgi:hypothetical protein